MISILFVSPHIYTSFMIIMSPSWVWLVNCSISSSSPVSVPSFHPLLPLLCWYNSRLYLSRTGLETCVTFLFPSRLFFVNLGHFPDLANHMAQQQLNGSHRGCRDVNTCGAECHHHRTKINQNRLSQWSYCFLLFHFIPSVCWRIIHVRLFCCFLLKWPSSAQLKRVNNFFKCFHRATPQHLSGASPWVPSVS